MNKILTTIAVSASFAFTSLQVASHEDHDPKYIKAAIEAEIRTDEDRARDASRRPQETLEFFSIARDMRVMELMPGGGWYTKILGTYLEDKGELFLAIGADPDRLNLEEQGLGHVQITSTGYDRKRTSISRGIFNFTEGDLGADNLDMVLTFRNAHNMTGEARVMLNKDIYDALKPGGIYGVIDHTKRHMEPHINEIWRRVDPVLIIKEAVDAGFEFVDYSDVHHRPDDKLIYDTRHESINTDSDRFTLKFRKPE